MTISSSLVAVVVDVAAVAVMAAAGAAVAAGTGGLGAGAFFLAVVVAWPAPLEAGGVASLVRPVPAAGLGPLDPGLDPEEAGCRVADLLAAAPASGWSRGVTLLACGIGQKSVLKSSILANVSPGN